jgi:hypothetical protein
MDLFCVFNEIEHAMIILFAYFYTSFCFVITYKIAIATKQFIEENNVAQNTLSLCTQHGIDLFNTVKDCLPLLTLVSHNRVYIRFTKVLWSELIIDSLQHAFRIFNVLEITEKTVIALIRASIKSIDVCWNGIDSIYLKNLTTTTQRLTCLS